MREWAWAAVGPLAALIAFHGALTTSRVYYLRDLSGQFWGKHLWLRRELLSGHFPLWDPYVGFGQSAIADPNRGLLFPPTLVLRFLPTVVGFNLIVALPFPILALGAYMLLRRHVSAPSAAFGSAALVLSGPSLSMANFPNMPWAFAFVPWALYVVDLLVERATRGRFVALAITLALVMLAGEGATLVGASALAGAYAMFGAATDATRRARGIALALVAAAGVAALMLGAVQALPLTETVGWSLRAAESNYRIGKIWSLHPVTLLETVASQVFGDPVAPAGSGGEWLRALNSGREPFLYSIYLGVGLLGLGLAGATAFARRRVARFWCLVAAVALVLALGDYTPIYPALRTALPLLGSVRYPAKFTVFVALAVTVLAAFGWERFAGAHPTTERPRQHAAIVALAAVGTVALAVLMWSSIAPASLGATIGHAGGALGADPVAAASHAAARVFAAMPRLVALAFGVAACLALGTDRAWLRSTLFALVLCDLLVASGNLVPTMSVAQMGAPSWLDVVREHPADRLYAAGRLSSTPNTGARPDVPYEDGSPPVTENPPAADEAALLTFLASFPGAWEVRDSISFDNSLLFPREYWDLVLKFASSSRDDRARVLGRVGVRNYVVSWPSWPEGTLRESFPDFAPLRLYEREPEVPRARVTAGATVVADGAARLARLFDARATPLSTVFLDAPLDEPVAPASEPAAPSAELTEDRAERVTIHATAPEGGGYVVLLDSFEPNWRATVDGVAAPIGRADALFRAVRIPAGTHEVDFRYEPTRFRAGLVLSSLTALALVALLLIRRRRLE